MASKPRIRFKGGRWQCSILSVEVWEANPSHRHTSHGRTPAEALKTWLALGRLNMQTNMHRSHLELAMANSRPEVYFIIEESTPPEEFPWWQRIDWWRATGRAILIAGAFITLFLCAFVLEYHREIKGWMDSLFWG